MTDPALLAEVADVVRSAAKIAPEVAVSAETRLVEDLAIDSLDLVGVLLKIQDHYGMEIEDEAVPSLGRVLDLARYVARHRETVAA